MPTGSSAALAASSGEGQGAVARLVPEGGQLPAPISVGSGATGCTERPRKGLAAITLPDILPDRLLDRQQSRQPAVLGEVGGMVTRSSLARAVRTK
jgi:hypothetical protein